MFHVTIIQRGKKTQVKKYDVGSSNVDMCTMSNHVKYRCVHPVRLIIVIAYVVVCVDHRLPLCTTLIIFTYFIQIRNDNGGSKYTKKIDFHTHYLNAPTTKILNSNIFSLYPPIIQKITPSSLPPPQR